MGMGAGMGEGMGMGAGMGAGMGQSQMRGLARALVPIVRGASWVRVVGNLYGVDGDVNNAQNVH
eukprot:CAMPEP_0173205126 /NCGR_PEP_ID=MMETSP1141-20130122/20553_1 /TAXON_ID=483371 /ORGANISM="non described non described, Strain CCMP2298" /LENGTH=63 /DNA_ID=CAMNT_0014130963 /DNA_START=1 /DNA_END=189 /DNA_ORIENTATION=-